MDVVNEAPVRKGLKPWIAGILRLWHWYAGGIAIGICWFVSVQLLLIAATFLLRFPLLPPPVNLGAYLIPFVARLLGAR